ncbi:MAG: tRNA(adenine34) deaminase [Candidatus Marinamargulisbacteria bacterium]|jgi:tRNA(adenine34) deaminase
MRMDMASDSKKDFYFMERAYSEAEKSFDMEEVPIGAVIVDGQGILLGKGANLKEHRGDSTSHAELMAIQEAQERRGDWRLNGCTLYTTLEPCPMCAGAMFQSRISRLVIGAMDSRWGAAGSVVDLFSEGFFNHRVQVDLLDFPKGKTLVQTFFKQLRQKSK